MAVPKFFEFFSPVLAALSSGDIMALRQIRAAVIDRMRLSKEDLTVLLPSGRQRTVDNRINWAITYLKKAGLVATVSRGKYQITHEGTVTFTEVGNSIDLRYLERFESFRLFHNAVPSNSDDQHTVTQETDLLESTPQDTMNLAFAQINTDLSDDLLSAIMEQSSTFFERLVVELLVKMGYGGAVDDAGVVVGQSGDEGIDGIIREDKLGFSSIYIQAKRWDTTTSIGRPEIQKFYGALAGQGATKGLYITTAQFSKEARNYVNKQLATKVVLVDGGTLTKLMIEYDVGVTTQSTYAIKRIDLDFFNDIAE